MVLVNNIERPECGDLELTLTLTPADAFGAFAGKSAQGTWTLKVADGTAGTTGDLLYWRVTIK